MDADGNFVVVWDGPQSGASDAVYAQRYNASGVPQGGEFQVNATTTLERALPSVAMDVAGNFVVAWQSKDVPTFAYGIYARRFNPSGAPLSDEFPVNTTTAGNHVRPAVAVEAAGGFVVAWRGPGQDLFGDIFAQRYNRAGAAVGGEFRVNTHTTNTQSDPAIAMDADGDFAVAWNSRHQDGSVYGIYAQRYSVAPKVTSAGFHLSTTP